MKVDGKREGTVSRRTWENLGLLQKKTFEGLRERTEHLDIFLFSTITQWCSISDVLFTGGREVSELCFKILLVKY